MNDPDVQAVVAALVGCTHFPANGARVICGWADPGGATWITDHPVLWFNADGYPVIADTEVGLGVEVLRPHYATGGAVNERWSVYHPDRFLVSGGPGLSASDEALQRVREGLGEYVMAGEPPASGTNPTEGEQPMNDTDSNAVLTLLRELQYRIDDLAEQVAHLIERQDHQ